MILWLIHFLSGWGVKMPFALTSISFRMVICAMTSMSLTVILGKTFIARLCTLGVGHTMRVSDVATLAAGYEKSEKVPSMGGLLFLFTILLSGLLWLDLTHAFSFWLILTLLWMGSIGGIDDFLKLQRDGRGLSPKVKLGGQLVLALLVSGYLFSPISATSAGGRDPHIREQLHNGEKQMQLLTRQEYAHHYYVPFFKRPIVISWIGVCLFMNLCVIAGSANAVNLTDGLDGLAAGLVMLTAAVLAIVAFFTNHLDLARYLNIIYIDGASEIGVFLSGVAGALLGFIWYNSYPAQVFMGDTGSLALGGVLGVSAILLRREFLLALVGGVFVIETLSVILQLLSYRYRNKKRLFLCAPIHHHFQMLGWHESKVVIRFWMIGLLFALLGIASLKFQ